MKRITQLYCRLTGLGLLTAVNVVGIFAQRPRARQIPVPESSGAVWFYVTVAVALISLGAVFYFWRKSRKSIEQANGAEAARSGYYNGEHYETDVDAEKEMEWLRKAKKSSAKSPQISYGLKKPEQKKKQKASPKPTNAKDDAAPDTKAFQDKMKMLHYAQLPINSFSELVQTRNFEMLLDADAKALNDAIDRSNEEFEPDEKLREAAIKTLASFRTSNSVEALSQAALYDISASLRAKAVTVLTDFDHETVFETILLACADPTREVKAAAARGLFKLNFDRSGAWKRIIDTGDKFRMGQAVRAASEAGIVTKYFDRLIHEDIKIAYEAFTLVALLIRSGEADEIFEALRDHKDERVKYALLHVLKAMKDPNSLKGLHELCRSDVCSTDVLGRIQDAIKAVEQTAVGTAV